MGALARRSSEVAMVNLALQVDRRPPSAEELPSPSLLATKTNAAGEVFIVLDERLDEHTTHPILPSLHYHVRQVKVVPAEVLGPYMRSQELLNALDPKRKHLYIQGTPDHRRRVAFDENTTELLLVRPHCDEKEAAREAPSILKYEFPGEYLGMMAPFTDLKEYRAVNFELHRGPGRNAHTVRYYFDLNRIFTNEGIDRTLTVGSRIYGKDDSRNIIRNVTPGVSEIGWQNENERKTAVKLLRQFRNWWLDQMRLDSRKMIVAVHNNRAKDAVHVRNTYNVIRAARADGQDGFVHIQEIRDREAQGQTLVVADQTYYDTLVRNGYTKVVLEVREQEAKAGQPIPPTAEERFVELEDQGYNVMMPSAVVGSDFYRLDELKTLRNFFLVTRQRDYEALRDQEFNVVLQRNLADLKDDGSLSIYCARRFARRKLDIGYISIETQEGDIGRQTEMLRAISEAKLME